MNNTGTATPAAGPHLTVLIGAHIQAAVDRDGQRQPLLFDAQQTLIADAVVAGGQPDIMRTTSMNRDATDLQIMLEPLLHLGSRELADADLRHAAAVAVLRHVASVATATAASHRQPSHW